MRCVAIALCAAAIIALSPDHVSAEAFDKATYEADSDERIVTIFYSGSHPDHEFQVVDSQERDVASQAFKKTVRFSLADLPCRPATVTLRASPGTDVSLKVPAAP